MLRIRYSAASVFYVVAWFSMAALIAMVTIAELLQGETAASADSAEAEAFAVRRVSR